MRCRNLVIFIILLGVLITSTAFSQISQGGIPIQVMKLKSSTAEDLVEMPYVDNQFLLKMNRAEQDELTLKPFRFAHAFPVKLNLNNSGKWYSDGEFNVWQLYIRSKGAYSLNLIFDQFKLPEGAKLFVISADGNEIKGAYTSANNKPYGKFAIEPVGGDFILLQYEEPVDVDFRGELQLAQIAHDFVGLKSDMHRPLGISGSCNIDVNCNVGNDHKNERDAVCRILIDGTELCSGTLVNNTAENGKPYLLTAHHCVDSARKAAVSIFLFNYQSPYCGSFDGDVSNSISGSYLRAGADSLDFSLLELSINIPYYYHPYFAGWDRSNVAPYSTFCIHHPIGDIKKISLDENSPTTASFKSKYYTNGFWKILKWDYGTTEHGSSGGALFNDDKQIIGSLTGGSASCSNPSNDYFAKFALAWNAYSPVNMQLKHWLDPLDTDVNTMTGFSKYTEKELCTTVTNFVDDDVHTMAEIDGDANTWGYWCGTNNKGFFEYAEKYSLGENCNIRGVSLGVGNVYSQNTESSEIIVRVYSGTEEPDFLLYSEAFAIGSLDEDAMNYLSFNPLNGKQISTNGDFFVSFATNSLDESDLFSVYTANRGEGEENTFFLRNTEGWHTFPEVNGTGDASAMLAELVVCDLGTSGGIDTTELMKIEVWPNPVGKSGVLFIRSIETFDNPQDIQVYDMLGKALRVPVTVLSPKKVSLDFSSLFAGVYIIRVEIGQKFYTRKIIFAPER